ncbi:MAG: flagellar biosynthesis repressor FlbT [Beijerinckiaceae bacterium]|nr:MAG: flagellar biosynthesis repressor FlbT [Beijerinckiaceae bacterium]
MHISLRAGEKFYINGAVVRVDRKVSIELLNDATFLLEAHVMRVDEVTTPLRQLYFIVQIMLMNPADTPAASQMFANALAVNRKNFDQGEIAKGLSQVERLVWENRKFEALKTIRALLPLEAETLGKDKVLTPEQAA